MNEIFYYILDEGIIAFINNIVIYTNITKQKYKTFVCKILDCLLKYRLHVVIEKCKFSVQEISYI